jgi:hypothetical protein
MPDFSQPGNDGALPGGVPQWRDGLGELTTRGLVYTSRGARSVLPCDRTYRITAAFKQKMAKGCSFTKFAGIYRRVTRLVQARAAEMTCAHGEPLHTRILGHTWTCIPGGSCDFPMAALVTELSCSRAARAEGEPEPTPGALSMPGGTPLDGFSRVASRPSEEFYNEYDTGDRPGTNTEPVSFSYGEHVETCSGIDYAPLVERAENRARFHYRLLAGFPGGPKAPFTVLRRDWWAVPDTLVVVVVYFQA